MTAAITVHGHSQQQQQQQQQYLLRLHQPVEVGEHVPHLDQSGVHLQSDNPLYTSCFVGGDCCIHAYLLNLDFALIDDLLQDSQLVDRDQFLVITAQSIK